MAVPGELAARRARHGLERGVVPLARPRGRPETDLGQLSLLDTTLAPVCQHGLVVPTHKVGLLPRPQLWKRPELPVRTVCQKTKDRFRPTILNLSHLASP